MNPRPAAYEAKKRKSRLEKAGNSLVRRVYKLVGPFLTRQGINDFYSWLVNERGVTERWARNVCYYMNKPLDLKKRHPVKAYRLFLIYLNQKYEIEVDDLLKQLKTPQSGQDLKIPSDAAILESYNKIRRLENRKLENVFLVLVYSGIRLSEVTKMFNEYDRSRLEIRDGIALYEMAWRRGSKNIYYIFMPSWLAERIEKTSMGYDYYQTMSKRHGLVRAKYIRKFHAQKFYEICENSDVVNFVQGRSFTGKKTVIFTHYVVLLNKSLKYYKAYAEWLQNFLKIRT